MNVKIFLLSSLILVFTSSCGGTYHAYYETLKIAFTQKNDVRMRLIEVQQSKTDVISVKRGESASVIMALAYLENNQHKWVSNDNVMLIMEKGRLIRTLGLKENLLYMSNTSNDPLKSLPNTLNLEQKNQQWLYMADFTSDEYGYSIESVFSLSSQDSIQVLNINIEATLYVETLYFDAPATYLQVNNSWTNFYWYTKSGELIKSIQRISPLSDSLEITYLSRIARLNQ